MVTGRPSKSVGTATSSPNRSMIVRTASMRLSKYMAARGFTSKLVSHIAHTNTTRKGLSASHNSLSSSRVTIFLR